MARARVSKVFFPWERRRGVFGVLGRARVRLVAAAVVGLVLVIWIRAREERAAGVRATCPRKMSSRVALISINSFSEGRGRAARYN